MAAPAQNLTEEQVVKHLLFHKAILGDDEDPTRINHYMEIVKQSAEGEHVAMSDPFDKAIALAFELVLSEHLDPWKIDLVTFTTMYLQRLRDQPQIDLITAGRLVLMAWTILKLQSDDAKARAEPPPPPPPEPEADPWFGVDAQDAGDPGFLYNEAVIDRGEVPIDEKIRHKGDRKVTFMELLEALEEARTEAEFRMELNARREAESAAIKIKRANRVEGAAHKENQEEDIAEVWTRIAGLNGHPIPLSDIQDNTREDVVKTLVSVLFLARASKIKLWQENFPYGPIYLQNATLHADGAKPEDSATQN